MRRSTIALFLAFLGALAGPAVAQTATTGGDSTVSAATAARAARLANADPGKIASRMMTRADTDHSGGISQAEWLAAGRKTRSFERMDTNHDGKLDRAELAAGVKIKQARLASKADSMPAGDAPPE